MPERHALDPQVLDARARRYAERSFLGGTRIGSRTGLLVFVGLVLAGGLGGVFFQLDGMAGQAFAQVQEARRFAQFAETARREITALRVHEKDFLLRHDPAASETLSAAGDQAGRTLDALYRLPAARGVQAHVATVRDGIAQYGSHFAKTVKIETVIGLSPDQGLRGQVQKTTAALEAKFREHGLSTAMIQLARVTRIGRESLLAETKIDHALIEKNYETLRLLVAATQIPARDKAALEEMVKAHENDTVTMVAARLKVDRETRAFDEVFGYIGPGLEEIAQAAERAGALAAEGVDRARELVRMGIAGGAGGTILFMVFFGALLLRSVFGPLRRVADAAGRLAAGERHVEIPVRGNIDAVGHVARSLDSWVDTLGELETMRAELAETKTRLARALAAPPVAVAAPSFEIKPAPVPVEPIPEKASETKAEQPAGEPAPAEDENEDSGTLERPAGRFASASEKLSLYSRAVTNAARDVERTETLVRGLAEATEKVIEMGGLVAEIRDQANLIAFKAGVREGRGEGRGPGGDDNLVLFSPEVKLPADAAGEQGPRFDAIRDAVDKAERTAQAVHTTLVEVTGVAQEVAATASNQALGATAQLLSQSEYLHHMLDDVLARVQPAKSERGKNERDGTKGERKNRD